MLAQRHGRWANIKTTLAQRVVFAKVFQVWKNAQDKSAISISHIDYISVELRINSCYDILSSRNDLRMINRNMP